MLEIGLTEIPVGVEEGTFIVSGARVRKEKKLNRSVKTLNDLFQIYEKELPIGSKEERTLKGEKLHFKHPLRHLRPKTQVSAIKPTSIQKYVELRSKDQYRGRFISPETIKKEITTLRLVGNWAKRQEYIDYPRTTWYSNLTSVEVQFPAETMVDKLLKSFVHYLKSQQLNCSHAKKSQ